MKILAVTTGLFASATAVMSALFFIARENQKDLVQQNNEITKEFTQHEMASLDARSFLRWYSLNEMDKTSSDKSAVDANIQILRSNYTHYYPDNESWNQGKSDIAWKTTSE